MSQHQGTPGGSALGLPYNPEDEAADKSFGELFSDEPQPGDVEETPAAEQQDEPSEGVFGEVPDDEDAIPTIPAGEAAPPEGEETPGEEEQPGEEMVTFLGRRQTLAQAEEQFRQIQRGFTDLAQSRQQVEAELEAQRGELEQVRQFLLQKAAEEDPELAARLEADAAMQRTVDERVRQQVEPLLQPIQQREAIQQVVQQAQGAVVDFYQRNGIQQGDERDNATLEVFKQIAQAGHDIDMTNPMHLDYALAVAEGRQAPPVGVIVPQLVTSGAGPAPGGGATVPTAPAAPGNGAPAAPKAPVRRRVEAHVETGGSGAPASAAPGAPKDEFDEAFDWYTGRKARGPLFGSPRT